MSTQDKPMTYDRILIDGQPFPPTVHDKPVADIARQLHRILTSPPTPEQIIVQRMVSFGVGWLDPEDMVGALDTMPDLEAWAHRDAHMIGPSFEQVTSSHYCSSAFGVNCCDLPAWHDDAHHDEVEGSRWVAARTNQPRHALDNM